jgi:hypothetical protein
MVFMIGGFSVGSYENVPHDGIWYGERGIVDDWCEWCEVFEREFV